VDVELCAEENEEECVRVELEALSTEGDEGTMVMVVSLSAWYLPL